MPTGACAEPGPLPPLPLPPSCPDAVGVEGRLRAGSAPLPLLRGVEVWGAAAGVEVRVAAAGVEVRVAVAGVEEADEAGDAKTGDPPSSTIMLSGGEKEEEGVAGRYTPSDNSGAVMPQPPLQLPCVEAEVKAASVPGLRKSPPAATAADDDPVAAATATAADAATATDATATAADSGCAGAAAAPALASYPSAASKCGACMGSVAPQHTLLLPPLPPSCCCCCSCCRWSFSCC